MANSECLDFSATILEVRMSAMLSKQDKVFNYLSSGRTLSADSAFGMFGVSNLRATVSDIKELAHSSGFNVVRTVGRSGETRYGFANRRRRG